MRIGVEDKFVAECRNDGVLKLSERGRALWQRREFLKLAALGGAAVAGSTWLDGARALASGRPSEAQDRQIFNFALLLEDLKSSFYAEALAKGGLQGELRQFAEVAGAHEREHASFLRRALGSHARPVPQFHFGASVRQPGAFAATASRLEELAVAAYNGQAGNLTKKGLGAAIEIVSVEARHAAWIRAIEDEAPAPRAADPGAGAAEVTAALNRLHIR
jgi:hypothetical protein